MLNDFKYALRAFARTPGFTLVAGLTLALGIGATTAVFSVVNAVLLRPLPYAAADRMVIARGSLPDLRDLNGAAGSFDASAMWATNRYNLDVGGDTHQVLGGQISRDLLPLLGVDPILGRNFTAEDDRQDTVILGYGLWQSRFGGDPAVLGRPVNLSGTSYTVIGVAPAWFRFPSAEFALWTPLGTIESKVPALARNRSLRIFTLLARLKPDTSIAQAQAEAASVSALLARTYPQTNDGVTIELRSLYDTVVGDTRPALGILLATVCLLLLIACANVANLMLARATVREREMAIRNALGAGRWRLLRQLGSESLTLALLSGAAGLLVALWGVDSLPAILEARLPRADGIRVDGTVLSFALGATLLTALFFGLAPALQSSASTAGALKESGRGQPGSARGRRTRRIIAAAQVALAVMVLVSAGLMIRSFVALAGRNPGFTPDRLLSFNVQFVKMPNDAVRAQAASLLLQRLTTLPEIERAGGATGFATVTPQRGTAFEIEGRTLSSDQNSALFIATTPGYFETLLTSLRRGRTFDAHDTAGGQPVVIINRTLADTLFTGEDAVGRRIRLVNPEQSNDWRTVVGVVDDVAYRGPSEEMVPTIYTPFAQTPFLWLYVMVRAPHVTAELSRSIRTLVPTVDPTLTAANLQSMNDVVAANVAEPRLNMLIVSSFALLALLLSAIGIYGVITYSVSQRTHEIGVRMALGAAASDVLRLVLREGLITAAAGVILGLLGAAALTRWMSALLFGVAARDPLTFAGGACILIVIAALASWIPAHRATRVEPIVALRSE
jgi:putative ABC transport system permease protein